MVAGTLDVAGDVDVNSGMFAVTASDGSLAIRQTSSRWPAHEATLSYPGILRLGHDRRLEGGLRHWRH